LILARFKMASQPGPSESTPLLAGNDQTDHQDEIESHSLKASPANAHFKLPIQILTIITSFLSLSIFGLLIATYVLIATGPFNFYYFGVTQDAVRHLAITVSHSSSMRLPSDFSFRYNESPMLTTSSQSFVTVIYSALTIPLQISIIINIAINIVVLVLTFVYSDEILGKGWPRNVGYALCGRPVDRECLQAIMAVRITMAVSAGVGILIG
jgi:hypothetical protein